jgi:hypothetical protein
MSKYWSPEMPEPKEWMPEMPESFPRRIFLNFGRRIFYTYLITGWLTANACRFSNVGAVTTINTAATPIMIREIPTWCVCNIMTVKRYITYMRYHNILVKTIITKKAIIFIYRKIYKPLITL